MDLETLKAQFLAKNTITRVAEGERAIDSSREREIYRAQREGGRVASDATVIARHTEARAEAQADAFRAAKHDGWSDADALDYAREAKP